MMSQDDEISIRQQAELLGVNRPAFYYKPVPPDHMNLYIKRLIDEAHTRHPELGSRRIGLWLKQRHSLNINRKAVLDAGSRISMDHRGRAFDNIFIERL